MASTTLLCVVLLAAFGRQSAGKGVSATPQQSAETQPTPPSMPMLASKVCVVSGGSGTIGKAVAEALLGAGAGHVVITSRSLKKLKAAEDDLGAGPRVSSLACDVTDETAVSRLFQDIQNGHGPCDLLVNSAGTTCLGATTQLSSSDFANVMNVNVLGSFLCAREAFKQMQQNQGGRIINVGSISSISPRPDSAPYTCSKFAIHGLTQSLALDGRAHNIAVGMINPGNVASEILTKEEIERREATEGFLDPRDVAQCVLAMASLPLSANVLDMTVIPIRQPLVGRG